MAKLFNLARMTSATVGTGTITLGSAVPGFLTFALAGVANGDIVSYGIKDGANSEVGTGTYSSAGPTLTRTPTKSTNADAAISLSGSEEVYVTFRKEDLFVPPTDDGAALGSVTARFSDLFLADGGVINWNNGAVTITEGVHPQAGGPLYPASARALVIGPPFTDPSNVPYVGIGTPNPLSQLEISASGDSSNWAPNFGGTWGLRVTGVEGNSSNLYYQAIGNGAQPLVEWMWYRARGTPATPLPVGDGDTIGQWQQAGRTDEPTFHFGIGGNLTTTAVGAWTGGATPNVGLKYNIATARQGGSGAIMTFQMYGGSVSVGGAADPGAGGSIGLNAGAALVWNAGAVFLTESAGGLNYATSADAAAFKVQNFNAGANGATLVLEAASSSPAVNDTVGNIVFRGRDSGAAVQDYGGIGHAIVSPTAGAEGSALNLTITEAGVGQAINFGFSALYPGTDNYLNLGFSGLAWKNLFLSSTAQVKRGALDYTPREKLTSARTYFVRQAGSDTNNGLGDVDGVVAAPGNGAFATIQKAIDVVTQELDLLASVTIQVRAGTYAGFKSNEKVGWGSIMLLGNTTTPSSVIINSQITVKNVRDWTIKGFRSVAPASGWGIYAQFCNVTLGQMEFSSVASASGHIYVGAASLIVIEAGSSYSIIPGGGVAWHILVDPNGTIYSDVCTVTITGAITMSSAYVEVTGGSAYVARSMTFTNPGNVTGKKCIVTLNAVVNSGGGTAAAYFPGTIAGVPASGGQFI